MTGFSLLPTAPEEGLDQHHENFKGVSRILGPKWAHLPTITVGLLGVQICWSIEMSYASPYLLSLGLSKSIMAVVFLAGPISGLVMQPLIGVLADNSTSSFGRRRPYMLLGTLICVFAMLLLGFTRPVASIFTGSGSHSNNVLTIWLAILAIWLIDFSINAVQAVDRALLVDTVPSSEQASGNAWAARMLGFGSVMGFFVANVDLSHSLPFLGNSQLQVLSVIGSLLLLAAHLLMSGLVKERVLVKDSSIDSKSKRKSFSQEAKELWNNLFTLPKVIRQICLIQFFAWIAWFPIIFYSTLYVGDLYKRSLPPAATDKQQTLIDAEATRLGSRALFYFALLALAINLILPAFVAEAAGHPSPVGERSSWRERVCRVPRGMQVHLVTIWAMSHLVFAGCMFATFFTHSVWGSTFIITITGFSWAVTQWAPFSLLAEAILTEPMNHDDVCSIHLADTRTWPHHQQTPQIGEQGERDVLLADESEDEGEGEEARLEDRQRVLGNSEAQQSSVNIISVGAIDTPTNVENEENDFIPGEHETRGRSDGASGITVSPTLRSKAGIILGIHNIFIVIPQFLVSGVAAILFALLDPQKPFLPGHRAPVGSGPILNGTIPVAAANVVASTGKEVLESLLLDNSTQGKTELDYLSHPDSVVYIFRIGGVAASLAFVLCWRLAREIRHK